MKGEGKMESNSKIKLSPLGALFVIEHGNKLDLNKQAQRSASDDSVAFVGRSGEDNGIVAFVNVVEGLQPYRAGLITVALGGAALSSFVQPRRFYTAQNIDVLTPKVAMSLDVKLYYCLCIEANRFRYSTFGREANRTLKNLMLPALEDVPDWVNGSSRTSVAELAGDLDAVLSASTSVE